MASASACSNDAPCAISLRMKFDVPFSTPAISHASATSGRRESDPRNGTPASTAASKANVVRRRTARARRSAPAEATSVLLAVTTGIPLSREDSTSCRAGSSPPSTSTITSTPVVTTFAASVESRSRGPDRLFRGSRTSASTQRRSIFAASSCARRRSAISATACPTRPYPSNPTRTTRRRLFAVRPSHRMVSAGNDSTARSAAPISLATLCRDTRPPSRRWPIFENGISDDDTSQCTRCGQHATTERDLPWERGVLSTATQSTSLYLPRYRAGSSTWAIAAWLLWRRRACSLSHSR